MSFDLTVLGCAGSHTGPGRACSGYLLQADGTSVLLDCGNGSTANLQLHCDISEIDAIVVTHRHVDHCVDLIGMYYALRFHDEGPRSIDLYAAPEVVDMLTGMLSEDSALEFREAFRCHEVTGGDHLDLGPFVIDLFDSVHPVPTVSVRVDYQGTVLTYSSDSAGGDQLLAAARGADTFLCEATWQGDADQWPGGIHLVARDAGRIAREAGVGRLVLTHVLGSLDRGVSLREAQETFDGEVLLAEDNLVLSLS